MRSARGWLLLLAAASVRCDVYMHNPRGSNNKLNEVSNNRANANRLFDSQNNGAGGYQVGDDCKPNFPCSNANGQYNKDAPGAGKGQMYFYEGSRLHLECAPPHQPRTFRRRHPHTRLLRTGGRTSTAAATRRRM